MIIRIGKNALKVLLAMTAMAVILLAAFIGRLALGPIPVAWAAPIIEQAMQSEGGIPAALTVNDMVLAWNADSNRLEFTAHNVSVTQQTTKLTSVDQVGMTFSVLALLRGHLQLKDLTLAAPHFEMTLGQNAGGATDAPKSSLLDDNKDFLHHLHSVTIHHGVLNLQHAGTEVHDIIDGVELKWKRNLWSSAGTLTANLRLAENTAASPLYAELIEKRDGIQISGGMQNFLPADMQFILNNIAPGALPANISLERLQMKTSLEAAVTLSPEGALQKASGTLTADTGHLVLPEYYHDALPLQKLEVRGSYDARAGNWQIDRVATAILDNDGAIPVVMAIDGNSKLRTIHVDAAMHDLSIAQLKRWWPQGVAPGAIDWININLKDGKIPRLAATVDLHAADGADYAVTRAQGGWDMKNITTTFLPTMPAVSGINGKAIVTDTDNIHFDIQSGRLGDIVLQPGTMDVSGLSADIQTLKMDLPATAQLPSVLRLLDTPPYEYIKKMGLKADSAMGGVGLDLKMEFPLLAALKIADIKYRTVANLSQVSLPGAVMGKDITRGQGVLEMDPERLKISGQADVSGVPMEFTWQDFLAPKDNLTRQVQFSSEMLDDDHARLALPTAGKVTGTTKLTGNYEVRGGQGALRAQMDFRDAAVRVDELSYVKPAGAALNVSTDMALGNPVTFKLNASGKDLTVSGNGALDSTFNPLRLNFPIVKVGSKNDLQLDFEQRGPQQRWSINGNALDISQFLTGKTDKPKELTQSATPPRWLQVKLGTIYLANQASMKNFQGEMNHNGQHWDRVLVHGELRPNVPVDVNWDITGPGHKLSARTPDAGGALSALDVTTAMIGGNLVLDGATENAKSNTNVEWLAHGTTAIKNFRMREVPLLGRLIAAVSPGGLLDALRGSDGVAFDIFESQFEYSDNLLRLRDGKMHGQSLGITFEGDIHHAISPKTLTINGTIVPLYMVNNALSGIPLIGDLISGKTGAGLLGFNYAASGPVEDPSVSVNPLSAFTPGFLRDLFFDNSTLPKK